MIPKDWTLTSLGCVSSIVTKGATPTTYGYDFVEKSTEAVRFLGAYNCSSDGNFKSDSVKWISRDADDMLKRSRLMTEDSIFCIVGNTIGSSFIVEKKILPANINQNVALIRVVKDLAHPKYIHYCLRSSYIQWQVKQEASTQAQPSLSLKQISDFRINLPPIHEQLKITAIISTWDKAIATTEKLLANSQHQKKALMQKLFFGKSRFSNFDDKFRCRFFYELLNIDSKNLGGKTSDDYLFDYISLSDVKSGRINDHLERHFFKDAPSRARRILAEGDILFSTVRPNLQGFAKVGGNHKECIASTGFSVLTPKDEVCGNYIYHYLYSSHITAQINTLVVGTNYPAINSSDVARLRIYCPGYEEQKRIARVLDNCDKGIEALNHKLFLLKQEKKALMQQLLTGKRRVNVEAA
ncbi:MAG: restriction endonuclease subunit S [Aeromonadaceae bacterium]